MRRLPLLTAILIVAGLYYWFELRHEPATDAITTGAEAALADPLAADPLSAKAAPVQVVVLRSLADETQAELILRGRTEAERRVQVAAETAGRVISAAIRRGTVVERGQVLCELDPGTKAAELAEAEAALEEAEALASASSRLSTKGFAAGTEVKQRQAQLRAVEARLDRARTEIERLAIRAPFDGLLETDTAETGTHLSVGANCAEIIDLDPITVEAYASEIEIGQLSLGQAATARLVTGEEAMGEVSFISRMGDEATRTFAVEVTIPNADHAIRAGMTAELSILLPPEAAHRIPQTALTLDDDGRLGVRVAEEGQARFYPVRIRRESRDGVWIEGLPETADVIVIGQEFVRDGSSISPVPATAGMLP